MPSPASSPTSKTAAPKPPADPIVGEVDVSDTTYRVLADDTLDEIALEHEISLQQLLANNPRVDASEPLRPGLRLVILPGQYLEQLAVRNQVVRAEDALEGSEILKQRNPGVDFPEFNGKAYAEKGTVLILRESTTIEEIAYINRITPDVIMGVNPSGRHTNPDGTLTPTTPLYPGDEIILPKTEISIASARNRLGIDKPLGVQYYEFLWDTIRLKFQNSFVSEENSLDIFLRALPQTLHLTVYSLIITLLVGIPIGVISAIRQDSWMDFGLRSFAILALAAPPLLDRHDADLPGHARRRLRRRASSTFRWPASRPATSSTISGAPSPSTACPPSPAGSPPAPA